MNTAHHYLGHRDLAVIFELLCAARRLEHVELALGQSAVHSIMIPGVISPTLVVRSKGSLKISKCRLCSDQGGTQGPSSSDSSRDPLSPLLFASTVCI